MRYEKVTQQEIDRALAACAKLGHTIRSISRTQLAAALNTSERRARSIRNAIYRLNPDVAPYKPPTKAVHETEEVSGDNRILTKVVPKRVKTLKDLIETCDIDTSEWEIERYQVNKWDMGSVPRATGSDKEGWERNNSVPVVTELYQVKVWLKRKVQLIALKDEIAALKAKAEKYAPKYPSIKITRPGDGNMLEINIADAHLGALIWGRETNGPDYDLKIAQSAWHDAVSTLIQRTGHCKFARVVLVLGNDQQDIDNRRGTTERGTLQDTDSRYPKICWASQDTSVWTIETLCAVAPVVDVITIPGNHDYQSTLSLGDYLYAWFRNVPQVRVNREPTKRKFVEHGTVMLMFEHGDNGKLDNYGRTMAAVQPAIWGRTKWHEAHTGDKHHRRLIEFPGYAVRILPSLRPVNAWSAENHFLGSIRAAEAFCWNEREGLIGTGVYSILD